MSEVGAASVFHVDIDGREVRITKPDRLLWPTLGLTKQWLLRYYADVAPVLLPHLRDRPVTLHRFPEGVGAEHWYQTRAPAHPDWVRTVTFRPERTGKVFDVVVIDDLPALVWAAQIGSIELHPFLGTTAALDRPRSVVFDLDPGPGADVLAAAAVALRLRDLLAGVGLTAFVKTSGHKGLHVVLPLDGSQPYGTTKPFARAVARFLMAERPERVTDNMNRAAREGKVLVDWSQNDQGKSTVAPYSLRGLPAPTVSMPLTWPELPDAVDTRDRRRLVFTAMEVRARLDAVGDPFEAVTTTRQVLPPVGTVTTS